jgi:hypothetical protein
LFRRGDAFWADIRHGDQRDRKSLRTTDREQAETNAKALADAIARQTLLGVTPTTLTVATLFEASIRRGSASARHHDDLTGSMTTTEVPAVGSATTSSPLARRRETGCCADSGALSPTSAAAAASANREPNKPSIRRGRHIIGSGFSPNAGVNSVSSRHDDSSQSR